jgi:hypothetical protein
VWLGAGQIGADVHDRFTGLWHAQSPMTYVDHRSDGPTPLRDGWRTRGFVFAALCLGATILLAWPTLRSDAETSSAGSVAPATSRVVAQAAPAPLAPPTPVAVKAAEMTMEQFLDRLMLAESGGRDQAANPRSTAVGPFQFIEATWLDVMRRHFPDQAAKQSPAQLLALRTDRATARNAAEAFTRDNAAYLQAQGLASTFPNLRLAFLLGPSGAARVLLAPAEMRVAAIVGPAVTRANPFMFGLTAEGLIARSARDIAASVNTTAGVAPGAVPARRARSSITVNCNITLPSCRRWLALAERKTGRGRGARTTTVSR